MLRSSPTTGILPTPTPVPPAKIAPSIHPFSTSMTPTVSCFPTTCEDRTILSIYGNAAVVRGSFDASHIARLAAASQLGFRLPQPRRQHRRQRTGPTHHQQCWSSRRLAVGSDQTVRCPLAHEYLHDQHRRQNPRAPSLLRFVRRWPVHRQPRPNRGRDRRTSAAHNRTSTDASLDNSWNSGP